MVSRYHLLVTGNRYPVTSTSNVQQQPVYCILLVYPVTCILDPASVSTRKPLPEIAHRNSLKSESRN
jgi:hypothetical protein